jgi:hypothetical protein
VDQSRKQSRQPARCPICDGLFKGLQSVMVAGRKVHRGPCEVKAVNADRYKLCSDLRAARTNLAALASRDGARGEADHNG